MNTTSKVFVASTLSALALLVSAPGAQAPPAQGPPPQRPQPTPAGAPPGFVAYPPRAVDKAAVERGASLYSVNCGFCHGADARGGDMGPNLRRTQLVLDDQNGELIAPVLAGSRADKGMPKFSFTDAQARDVAAFLHSLSVNARGESAPPSILVGNAAAGEAYFKARCTSCHSTTGDLRGLASRYADPKTLQQTWLMPGSGGSRGAAPGRLAPRPKVIVTLASGERIEGLVHRLDNFWVSVQLPDGSVRGFETREDTPRVEIKDPLEGHRQLLPGYADADIHNVTAYLVTLK